MKKVCEVFKQSPFVTYTDSAAAHTGDGLTNAIHPIFRKRNFSKEFRYDVLAPSLRLATRLLTCDTATLYILTFIDGKLLNHEGQDTTTSEYARQYAEVESADNPTRMEDLLAQKHFAFAVPPTQKVGYHERRRAAAILNQVAEFVYFKTRAGFGGAATIPSKTPHTGRLLRLYPEGCPSHVELHLTPTYLDLVDVRDAATIGNIKNHNPSSTRDLIALRFYIARMLIHEIGHVVHALKFGGKSPEVFCGASSKCSEAGYGLEAAIFGGVVECLFQIGFSADSWDIMQGTERPSFYLRPWPSLNIYLSYAFDGGCIGWAGGFGQLPEPVHRIPYSFIASLFEDECWQGTFKQQRLNSVHPPYVGDWLFVTQLNEKGYREFGAHPLQWNRIIRKYKTTFEALGMKKDDEPEDVLDTTNLGWLN
jgi:hypothetical protein